MGAVIVLLISSFASASATILPTAPGPVTHETLWSAWRHFSHDRGQSLLKASRHSPVDGRLLEGLKECRVSTTGGRDPSLVTARTLSPSDVEIYAEVGHLLRFCGSGSEGAVEGGGVDSATNSTFNGVEDLDPVSVYNRHRTICRHSLAGYSSKPSLPRILRYFKEDGASHRQLEVYESHSMHPSLQSWTRHIVEMVVGRGRGGGNGLKWKLIVLAPGLYVSLIY